VRMYRHERVNRMTELARRVVRALFARYMDEPSRLPEMWRPHEPGEAALARRVTDYIAGMTDRFALDEHDRLAQNTPDK